MLSNWRYTGIGQGEGSKPTAETTTETEAF